MMAKVAVAAEVAVVANGTIDVQGYDFAQSGPISLKGHWRFLAGKTWESIDKKAEGGPRVFRKVSLN